MDKWFCKCVGCGNEFLVDNDEFSGLIGQPDYLDGELVLIPAGEEEIEYFAESKNYCYRCFEKMKENSSILKFDQ